MDKALAILATITVGAIVALQPPVNSQLARHSTVLVAAFVSFFIGALALGVLVLAAGEVGSVGRAFSAPPGYLTGGLMGVALITVSLVTVRTLGAGGVVAATVTGQLVVSLLLDRWGLLGLDESPVTVARVVGVALLVAGTVLVVR